MMNHKKASLLVVITCFLGWSLHAQDIQKETISVTDQFTTEAFPLVHSSKAASIFIDSLDAKVVHIAVEAFSKDIESITGIAPEVVINSSGANVSRYPVIIGTIGQSFYIDQLAGRKDLKINEIRGKWECFIIAVVDKPFDNVEKALVIAGSDRRGTAFGVFELSRLLGVSPWYWWADVKPRNQENLYVSEGTLIQNSPSVKYRGIFLNDEDWGLQPWAARNIDKEIKDIGPNTYAKIFELLLRLKANLIWPAMHPSTKAFFHYPENPKIANEYAIVVGTSHAEPMLRNNVDEWNEKTMGPFDYFSNKPAVYQYWEKRVTEAGNLEAIYTLGMRGVHDSGMKGAGNTAEAAGMLEQIIADQRGLLQKNVKKEVTAIPQAFTAYKEVLEIYDHGLRLPQDITIVWPDDNYGYIQRLSNHQEQTRPGGSGVYYHASYWGRPHDYLWLSSTHPSLIWEEMWKAYQLNSKEIWVLNAGDIKPLEYNIDLFLSMAYDIRSFNDSKFVKKHFVSWLADIFGEDKSAQLSEVLWEYYDLAFERRPEFMGWSRTEPTTQTTLTEYNHFYFGDEAQKRIDRYNNLEKRVRKIREEINSLDADAFYQLVYYPVVCASLMNKKFLYHDKSVYYARQNRLSAGDYTAMAKSAYDSIVSETLYYNESLAGAKWNGMMSMKPRNLPVYQNPELPDIKLKHSEGLGIMPEGFIDNDSSFNKTNKSFHLPEFSKWSSEKYFIDIYLTKNHTTKWEAIASDKWIKLSEKSGVLTNKPGQNQKRIWISVDWAKAPKGKISQGNISIKSAGTSTPVGVKVRNPLSSELDGFKGFIEANGYISIFAENHSRKNDAQAASWSVIEGLGYTGKSIMSLPLQINAYESTEEIKKNAPSVEYDFYVISSAEAVFNIISLPTHPVTSQHGMRFAISVDDGPVEILNFQTLGRSEEWKRNVLSNSAITKFSTKDLASGKHTLKIYMVDPGVILDRITIDLGGLKKAYSSIPETRLD